MNDRRDENLPAKKAMVSSLRQSIEAMGNQFKLALPAHIPPDRFMRIIFTAVQRNPKLLDCTRDSILAGTMRAAEQGLLPDGRQGALVPHKIKIKGTNRWENQAQFFPQWQGLLDLARQSGAIDDAFVTSVRENDEFEYELGLNRKLVHKPAYSNRGAILFVYAVAELSNGSKTFGPGPMTVEEVEAIRARSRAKDSGPWVTDWEAMAWKTVLKRTLKYVPQSPELQAAIEQDNRAEFGEWTISDTEPGEQEEEQSPATVQQWPIRVGQGEYDWQDADGIDYAAAVDAQGKFLFAWNSAASMPAANDDGTFRAGRGKASLAAQYRQKFVASRQSPGTEESAPADKPPQDTPPQNAPPPDQKFLDEMGATASQQQSGEGKTRSDEWDVD